jgi:starch phosphorylase
MKLALNGAPTVGTLDGANVEIREHVGPDNIFIFGLKTHEVEERRRQGLDATATIAASPMLERVMHAIDAGIYWPGEGGLFAPLMHALRHHDYYMVTADFDDYLATQRRIDKLWLSSSDWTQMCMRNIGHMAWFSSDRSIAEYAHEIWNVPVTLPADASERSA